MTEWYALGGIALAARDVYDGLLIARCARDRAEEFVKAARHYPWLWRILVRLTESSDLATALVGHAWMLYAIRSHHMGGGNEQLLLQLGYHPSQVLAPPPEMGTMDGQQDRFNGTFPTGEPQPVPSL